MCLLRPRSSPMPWDTKPCSLLIPAFPGWSRMSMTRDPMGSPHPHYCPYRTKANTVQSKSFQRYVHSSPCNRRARLKPSPASSHRSALPQAKSQESQGGYQAAAAKWSTKRPGLGCGTSYPSPCSSTPMMMDNEIKEQLGLVSPLKVTGDPWGYPDTEKPSDLQT